MSNSTQLSVIEKNLRSSNYTDYAKCVSFFQKWCDKKYLKVGGDEGRIFAYKYSEDSKIIEVIFSYNEPKIFVDSGLLNLRIGGDFYDFEKALNAFDLALKVFDSQKQFFEL